MALDRARVEAIALAGVERAMDGSVLLGWMDRFLRLGVTAAACLFHWFPMVRRGRKEPRAGGEARAEE